MPDPRPDPPGTARTVIGALGLIVLVAPTLAWVLLDRRIWVNDAALYGWLAVGVHAGFQMGPAAGWDAMMSVGPKAPGLPWIGAALVPLGAPLDHLESALLLVNAAAQLAALGLLAGALRSLTASAGAVAVGVLGLATTPLFVRVPQTFYVQPLQTAIVCWFLYVATRAGSWPRGLTIAHLASASALGFLLMMATPLWVFVPGLVAVGRMLRSDRTRGVGRPWIVVWVVLAIVLVLPTAGWYLGWWEQALAYGRFGFGYRFGGLAYPDYLSKLRHWVGLLGRGAGLTSLVVVLLPWILWRSRGRDRAMIVAVLLLVAQVAVTLVGCAASAHQTSRYVLPLLPYLALGLGWAGDRLGRRIPLGVAIVLTLQGLVFHGQAFGDHPERLWPAHAIEPEPLQRSGGRQHEIAEAVSELARRSDGTLLALSAFDLYADQITFEIAKRDPARFDPHGHDVACFEFVLAMSDADVDAAWASVLPLPPLVVTTDPAITRDRARTVEVEWREVREGAAELAERLGQETEHTRMDLPGFHELVVHRRPTARTGTGAEPDIP